MKRRLLLILVLLAPLPFLPIRTVGNWFVSTPEVAQKVQQRGEQQTAQAQDAVLQLRWRDMIPDDFHPEDLLTGQDFSDLDDSDPRVKKVMDAYMAEVNRAPTIQALHGRRVKIAGYVVPLETDGEVTAEFLLVPYFGACIHVPPPPANQVVHVRAVGKDTVAARSWYETVWVIGRLAVERVENDVGNAGYAIAAERIEPFEEQEDQPASPG